MDTLCRDGVRDDAGQTAGAWPGAEMKRYNGLKAASDLNRAVFAQNHLYGIDCKISGAVDLLSEVEGSLPIVHGTRTCGYQHRIFPLRIATPAYGLACTGMDETDIIYGGTGRLKKTILEAYRRHRPRLIGVLSSCVSGLMGEDCEGTIMEAAGEVPCPIVYVKTDGFRHRGSQTRIGFKRYLDFLRNGVWDMETEGCGWDEATMALIDQVMERQDVCENTVNLECYGQYNYGYRAGYAEIRDTLQEMGIGLNTPFPHATVRGIKNAPAAALNVSQHAVNLWPGHMKKRFGTDYVQKTDLSVGFPMVEGFYRRIGGYFGLDGEADAAVRAREKSALASLEPFRRHFSTLSFALHSGSLLLSPYTAKYYAEELGLPIRHICLDTSHLAARHPMPEDLEECLRASLDILSGMDLRCSVDIDPGKDAMRDIAGKVDYVLTDMPASPALADDRVWGRVVDISGLAHLPMTCSFGAIVLVAGIVYRGLGRPRPRCLPIIRRIELDPRYHQSINDLGSIASRRLWLDNCINSRV